MNALTSKPTPPALPKRKTTVLHDTETAEVMTELSMDYWPGVVFLEVA